ncbi:MAG TPA: hypothetical protein DFS52_09820 [Myxococcales bacterium]|jgi:hypothetical protein|nr:hypothetical protein [Myxococcales bacterium]
MDDLLQKPTSSSLAKQRSISISRLIYWGVAITTGLLSFFVPWVPGPLSSFAVAYGLDGAVGGRIRMTSERELRGRRARRLGTAFIALGIAHFALAVFERSHARPFADLSGMAGLALLAALYGPFLTLWILGLVWSRPHHESPAGTSK